MPKAIRPIPGFPGYHIGSDGRVWSRWRLRRRQCGGRGTESYISDTLKEMKVGPAQNKRYLSVTLRKDGRYFDFLVHRLVLETYVGPCPEGMMGLHKDDVGTNNKLGNLYWGTRSQNAEDAIRNGGFARTLEAAANANRGKTRSEAVRKKIADSSRGKVVSESHKANIAATHWSKGPNAEAIKARLAAARLGKTMPEEQRLKIKASCLATFHEKSLKRS